MAHDVHDFTYGDHTHDHALHMISNNMIDSTQKTKMKRNSIHTMYVNSKQPNLHLTLLWRKTGWLSTSWMNTRGTAHPQSHRHFKRPPGTQHHDPNYPA